MAAKRNGQKPDKPAHTLDDISDEFLACRDYGHAWRAYDVRIDRKYSEIHRVFSCLHDCGTLRTQVLTASGFIVRSFYTYPDGYVLPGMGRLSQDDRAKIRVMGTNFMKAHGM